MAPYTESQLRVLENFNDPKYSGEKDKYDIGPTLETHQSVVEAVKTLEDFIRQAKIEMKRLMGQVEKAREEMNRDNATLLAILKMMPDQTERKDTPGIRKWAEGEADARNPGPGNAGPRTPGQRPGQGRG